MAAAQRSVVVFDLTDRDVAVAAENPAHPTGHVVVIDVVGVGLAADRAPAALRSEKLLECLEREPVLPLEVALAIRDLLLPEALNRAMCCPDAFGILALPLARALDVGLRVLAVLRLTPCEVAGFALGTKSVAAALVGVEVSERLAMHHFAGLHLFATDVRPRVRQSDATCTKFYSPPFCT